MKYILILSIALLFNACEKEKEVVKVYVDVNGTEIVIKPKPKYKTFNREIECDEYGYAYYKEIVYNPPGGSSPISIHTPIFYNDHRYGFGGAYQVECKDLK